MKDKYFLDSNILVYAHDYQYPEKQEKAQEAIFNGLRSGVGVISTQVLSEFFVTITQKIKKPLSLEKARKEILLLSHLEVIEIDVPIITHAIDIKLKWKISYWDSLIISTAERGCCSQLYTEDLSDGQKYGTVKISNIFSF